MSRIGNKPIPVPKGVTVNFQGGKVTVKGPKGSLERDILPEMSLAIDGDTLTVQTSNTSRTTLAMKGLTRSLVNNMVIGVGKGFQRKLIVEGVGYKVEVNNTVLQLNVGFSSPVMFNLPEGIVASVDKTNTITLEGIDKELLGLTAARIRDVKKPEPYKGKGIRYSDEHIVRKIGKSGSK